ncbi:MAG: hypothetical protein V7K19_07715 [Nostoc sp.]
MRKLLDCDRPRFQEENLSAIASHCIPSSFVRNNSTKVCDTHHL